MISKKERHEADTKLHGRNFEPETKRKKRFSLKAIFLVVFDFPWLKKDIQINAEAQEMIKFMIEGIAHHKHKDVAANQYQEIAKKSLLEQFVVLKNLDANSIKSEVAMVPWLVNLKQNPGEEPMVRWAYWQDIANYPDKKTNGGM